MDNPLPLQNRCLESKSPYVRSHATNPTAWQLWSPESLALALKTNRLLFVSIGYSACHWCHVMAKESFDNPAIAAYLNANFIPVKVDREERPDIDRVYMDFLQATTGGGGWPLNVFVTPQLEPIYGGTYWPGPDSDRTAMGGAFDQVLQRVASAWNQQEGRCRQEAAQVVAQLRHFSQEGTISGRGTGVSARNAFGGNNEDADVPELESLEDAYQYYASRYDDKEAGFGPAPKFPTPTHLAFLLRLGRWHPTASDVVGDVEVKHAQSMACKTLEKMALGGIHDQLAGGFARYSVTRDWSLPHFEKMLYDNAQLLSLYLDAWLLTKSDLFLGTAQGIARYLTSAPIWSSETGAFHASEDADSPISGDSIEHKEGAYYVWTADEFRYVVGDGMMAKVAAKYWNVQERGNVNPKHDLQGELAGQNTLCVSCSIADVAADYGISETEASDAVESARAKLLAHRVETRPRPGLDDKIIVSYQGLAISALARYAAVMLSTGAGTTHPSGSDPRSDPDCSPQTILDKAIGAAEFIKENMYNDKTHTLLRVYRDGPGSVAGLADDYAYLIAALLDLYEATFDDRWVSWASELQDRQIVDFYDAEPERSPADESDHLESATKPTIATETHAGASGASSAEPDLANVSSKQVSAPRSEDDTGTGTRGCGGGFFGTPLTSTDILIRSKDAMDNAEPSTNGVSGMNLFRLASLLSSSSSNPTEPTGTGTGTGVSDRYARLASETTKSFEIEIGQHPGLFTGLLGCVVCARLGVTDILIAGRADDGLVRECLAAMRSVVWPGRTVVRIDGADMDRSAWLRGRRGLDGFDGDRAMVQVCRGTECRLVKSGEELIRVLEG